MFPDFARLILNHWAKREVPRPEKFKGFDCLFSFLDTRKMANECPERCICSSSPMMPHWLFPHWWAMALISHASKVMFKIFQARLQQYMNLELPDVQTGFRDQIANIHWIIEKAKESQRYIYCCFIDYAKARPLTMWITTNWKILQEMGTPTMPAEKSVCRSRNNS